MFYRVCLLCFLDCLFCSEDCRSMIEDFQGVDHTPRGEFIFPSFFCFLSLTLINLLTFLTLGPFLLGGPRDDVMNSNDALESSFEFQPGTSTNRHFKMACNLNNEEHGDFEEDMMLDPSTIPIFDSCGCEPTVKTSSSSTHLFGQALEEHNEDEPFEISSRPSFITLETTHNVHPFSDSATLSDDPRKLFHLEVIKLTLEKLCDVFYPVAGPAEYFRIQQNQSPCLQP
ncbi:hypothetical protein DFH28DRAFT_979479 [Melampsora americana]|nr:hypothetical protein DFH28DRAFT_979479 [Melampsora americana]